jgi:hypothetical protein
MTNYGGKVSKTGKNVTSSTPEDFIFDSDLYGSMKIIQEGAGQLVINASSEGTATISHSFGFAPIVMIFGEYPISSGKWVFGIDSYASWNSYVTDSNLYIKIYNSTGSQVTRKYYYYMFSDTVEYT